MTIENARSLEDPPTLEREGIMLARHASEIRDFRDAAEVRQRYPGDLEALIVETWRAGVPHSAFDDPTCPPGSAARMSIEARVFAVYN